MEINEFCNKFKTRTIMKDAPHPSLHDETWDIALDMGYSSVKLMSQSFMACFPSYARIVPKDSVTLAKSLPTDILYRDNERSDVWAVGEKAIGMISIESTNDSSAVLYGRNRYFSDLFRVTSRVGLALALTANEYGNPAGKKIRLQTGLPPKYMTDDKELLIEALSGEFSFDIKIADGDWMHFQFDIDADDVAVTQQPMGTMVSVSIDRNGNPVEGSSDLFHSNMLVFDPGFKTGDCCLIKKGTIDPNDCQTFTDLSMYEVLQRTSNAIMDQYGVLHPVPAIQPVLESGTVKVFDKKSLRSKIYDITDILKRCNNEVCQEALDRLCEIYNYFQEIDYLVITGGTGAAWSNYLRDKLRGLDTLKIISGNVNEDIPYTFSNVRGYYMYLIHQPVKEKS